MIIKKNKKEMKKVVLGASSRQKNLNPLLLIIEKCDYPNKRN